jgi:small neutral amino acid transporter SnatA (MarC family)
MQDISIDIDLDTLREVLMRRCLQAGNGNALGIGFKSCLLVFGGLSAIVMLFYSGLSAEANTLVSGTGAFIAQATPPPIGDAVLPDVAERFRAYYGVSSLFNLFIIFFVTIGPLKIIGPFVKLTHNADEALRSKMALRAFIISTITVILVAILGQNILKAWRINLPALIIGSGILIFLSALRGVQSMYEPPSSNPPPAEPSMNMVIRPLVFPTILTPYGIALVVTFMTIATRIDRTPNLLLGVLLLIMLLNLVVMMFARPILKFLKPAVLQVIGLVLGVMQFILGVEWIIAGIEVESLILRILGGN